MPKQIIRSGRAGDGWNEWMASLNQVVAFVWLDTSDDRQGVFSDNAFLMRQPERTVSFYARDEIADPQAFRDRITILHLAQIIRQIS